MNKEIFLEADFFLSSFFWGIILLFLYDCIRIFRQIKHHIWAAVAAEDCLFWGIAGIFVFRMVYEKNFGIIRAYAGGGMLLGMWLYLSIISKRYIRTVVKLIHMVEKKLDQWIRFLTKPLRFLYTKIDKQLSRLSQFLKHKIDTFVEKRKKRLQSSYNQYKIKRNQKREQIRKEKEEKKKQYEEMHKAKRKNEMTAPLQEVRRMGVLERIEPVSERRKDDTWQEEQKAKRKKETD